MGGGGHISPDFEQEFRDYVNESWRSHAKWAVETQSQLMKWLFTMQGAGIAGSLGLAHSAGGLSCPLTASLVCFTIGIVGVLMWATLMYYFAAFRFRAFKNDVAKVDQDKMTFQDFFTAQTKRARPILSCEITAWLSGLLGLAGLAFLIVSVTRG